MRKIKRTPNHVFLPLGIYVSCNLCPCCNLSPCPSHNDCRYESACQLKYHVKEINGDIFSPNCKLINIRYTKGNKPGHTHSYAKLKVFEKYDDAREAIYGKRIYLKGK